jgi:hypothetical protein
MNGLTTGVAARSQRAWPPSWRVGAAKARKAIRKSKTDQEGQGRRPLETIGIARGSAACPVRAVKAWLQAAGITEGAIFRPVPGEAAAERLRPRAVANIVKRYASGSDCR